MTCKDYIHYCVCKDLAETLEMEGCICNNFYHFKDQSRIIELPCKVGDTVYVLEYEDDCAVDYSGCIFIMANNDFAFLSPIINGERNPIEICNVFFDRYINFDNNSGIIVPLNELYLTKEEAEAKLKELNNGR